MIQLILNLIKSLFGSAPATPTPIAEAAKEPIMNITLKEILQDKVEMKDLPAETQMNLMILLQRVNKVRDLYGKPMRVTSGLRTIEDHLRIYKDIANKKNEPFDPSKVPMKSTHLSGEACDFYDPKRELQAWCIANEKTLEKIELWMESFEDTPNWTHFQIKAPASGKRWFKP